MMANTDEKLRYLLRRYFNGKITEEEYQELWKVLQTDDRGHILSEELQLLWEYAEEKTPAVPAAAWNEKMGRLLEETKSTSAGSAGKKPVRRYIGYAAAMIAVCITMAGIYLYRARPPYHNNKSAIANHTPAKDISPGGNKAVLILANGATVLLDSSTRGIISRQGNTRIIKPANGKIAYNQLNTNQGAVVYNTIRTPRGGQYEITLSDGTDVWLNSASSLRFPTSFMGNERVVEMTGEAYFEVKENAAKPFIVTVDGMQVKVLGTHFNIMAYDDEPLIKTTLLQGAVSIKKGAKKIFLKAGQQAKTDRNGAITIMKDANVNKAVAWKNNLFWFDGNTIQEVMRQISRWYDADVAIRGNIPQHFTGSIPRNVDVLKVFQVLQETGNIHFKVIGRKIIVTP